MLPHGIFLFSILNFITFNHKISNIEKSVGLLLSAIHIARRIDIAVSVSRIIVAIHKAIRINVAVEIVTIAIHVRAVRVAALLNRISLREILISYLP